MAGGARAPRLAIRVDRDVHAEVVRAARAEQHCDRSRGRWSRSRCERPSKETLGESSQRLGKTKHPGLRSRHGMGETAQYLFQTKLPVLRSRHGMGETAQYLFQTKLPVLRSRHGRRGLSQASRETQSSVSPRESPVLRARHGMGRGEACLFDAEHGVRRSSHGKSRDLYALAGRGHHGRDARNHSRMTMVCGSDGTSRAA
jgi:hypothetical protein